MYTYLPNWLNSLTDEQLRAPPMSANIFQQYIRRSHLEATMANSVRKMALKYVYHQVFYTRDYRFISVKIVYLQ